MLFDEVCDHREAPRVSWRLRGTVRNRVEVKRWGGEADSPTKIVPASCVVDEWVCVLQGVASFARRRLRSGWLGTAEQYEST